MEINRNKYVALSYELFKGGFDGELIERAVEKEPLSFIVGTGIMLPKFEEKVLGLKQADNYEFMIGSDDAYGPYVDDKVVTLPKDIFKVDDKINEDILVVDNVIPMMDTAGNRLNGKVLEVADADIKMDFNHPMAGQDLYFKGSVLEVRDATESEIIAATQPSGGCGCGSGGGCGDGGCDDGSCGTGPEDGMSGGCGSGCGCN